MFGLVTIDKLLDKDFRLEGVPEHTNRLHTLLKNLYVWHDLPLPRDIFNTISRTNNLDSFLVQAIFSQMGRVELLKAAEERHPLTSDAPNWMRDWLNFEHAGRSGDVKRLEKYFLVNRDERGYGTKWMYLLLISFLDGGALKRRQFDETLSFFVDEGAEGLKVRVFGSKTQPSDPELLLQYAQYQYEEGPALLALSCFDRCAGKAGLNYKALMSWIDLSLCLPLGLGSFKQRLAHARKVSEKSDQAQKIWSCYEAIYLWIVGDHANLIPKLRELKLFLAGGPNPVTLNSHTFSKYIARLGAELARNVVNYQGTTDMQNTVYVLGESHALSPAHLVVPWHGQVSRFVPKFVMGVKMFHLGTKGRSDSPRFCDAAKAQIAQCRPNSHLLVTIGEIDTRLDEGIWPLLEGRNWVQREELISTTVDEYLANLCELTRNQHFRTITVQGVPAPASDLDKAISSTKLRKSYIELIRQVNDRLKGQTLLHGWAFLDVYTATCGDDGTSNKKWHIDDFHLKPSFYLESEHWLIKSW